MKYPQELMGTDMGIGRPKVTHNIFSFIPSRRSSRRSATRLSTAARSDTVLRCHKGCARCATATAVQTSLQVELATFEYTLEHEGYLTSAI